MHARDGEEGKHEGEKKISACISALEKRWNVRIESSGICATYVNFNPTDETKILLPEIYPFSFSRAIRYFLSFFLKLYVPPEIVESRRNVNKTFNDDTLFLFPSFFCFLITEKNINFLCFEMNTVFSTS